ncbi:MAG: hypothetical protein JSV88_08765, partial [Candidatus Aminicenantes bacterium]
SVSARHNHFKLYVVKSAEPFEPIVVKLKDQFDKEPHKAKLEVISYFANPVEKRHGEATYRIEFPNAHLTWYKFQTEVKPVKRGVKIKNQFGEQILLLEEPLFLAVPTQKIEPGSAMPEKFNHFKAYRVVKSDFEPKEVVLKDQWDGKPIKVKVIKPFLFCNPVVKITGKMKAPIYNEGYHLTCYFIDPKGMASSPKSIEIKNQFGKRRLYPQQYFVLCVPTDKLESK